MAGNKSYIGTSSPDVANELKRRGLDGDYVEDLRQFVFKAQEWSNAAINEINFFKNARMVVGDEEDLSRAISVAYERNIISRIEVEDFVNLLNNNMESYLERFTASGILEPSADESTEETPLRGLKTWWKFWR